MTDHPITPPPELVQQWINDYECHPPSVSARAIATAAARWGADQELEACCEYLTRCAAWEPEDVQEMRDLRRPKPSSLAEEALTEIQEMEGAMYSADLGCDFTATRRALEYLQELENND